MKKKTIDWVELEEGEYIPCNPCKWLDEDLCESNRTKKKWWVSASYNLYGCSSFEFWLEGDKTSNRSMTAYHVVKVRNTFWDKLRRLFREEDTSFHMIVAVRKIRE